MGQDVFARATHIEVEAEVRYWEDATVNGVEDSAGDLIPGRDGDLWKVRINLAEGRIEGWPANVAANLHYKVCDAGEYWLTNAAGERLARWKGQYVPAAFLCHGSSRHSDYIIMRIREGGRIAEYREATVDPEQWAPLAAV